MPFMENERIKMQIEYNTKGDVLYLRLEDPKQRVINKRISDDIVLDIGKGEKIIGIEIVGASTHINLKNLLPVEYHISSGVPI